MKTPQDWETKKPVLKRFTIEGLFGYKTVSLEFTSAAKIISAENGTGKTTLLNALYWILTGQFFRLQAINFQVAIIVFQGGGEARIEKDELTSLNIRDTQIPSMLSFRRYGLSKEQIAELMTNYLAYGDGDVFRSTDLYRQIYQSSPWDHDDIRERIHTMVERAVDTEQFSEQKKIIEDGLQGVELLYLPTYRRIEASLGLDKSEKVEKAESSKDRLIYFGLTDVEDTLNEITAKIKTSTLEAYSNINAAFLDKLIEVADSNNLPQAIGMIDRDAMKMVLARIGKNSYDRTVTRIDDLISTGDIDAAKYVHLNYFLSELTQIGHAQAGEEEAINKFITVVNEYWKLAGSEKEFIYDKYKVEVFVKNTVANTKIPLHVLSSGEKQIVSIFSRLTFSKAKEYFVIIDEPELSLSIQWQKLFLPDIIASTKCRSLLAITHSPFVIENPLDQHAGPLLTSDWSK